MSHYCIFLFFIVTFVPDQGISFPLNYNGTIEKSIAFGDFRQNEKKTLPKFVMDTYRTYAKEDGTLKGDEMPAAVHYVLGKGRA